MDFKPASEHFKNAIQPFQIKEQWNDIESYVYIISRELSPTPDSEPLHLVKIGMSRTGRDQARLFEFRTSLLHFNVERIFLYGRYDFKAKSESKTGNSNTYAFIAEQALHEYVVNKYKPAKVRIHFSNDNPSEWFDIPKNKMKEFLDFVDKKVLYDIMPSPLYATGFRPQSSYPIFMKKSEPKIIGMEVIGDKAQKKETYRKVNTKYAMSLRQRRSTDLQLSRIDAQKKEDAKKRTELKKTVDFWHKIFKNKTFKDPDLSKKYTLEFTEVIHSKQNNQPVAVYEPFLRQAKKDKLTESEKMYNSGYLSINEAMDQIPSIKKKYKASYDWFVRKNNFEETVDYQENVR